MTSRTPADRALLRLLGRRGGLLTAGEAASRSGYPLAEVESALLRLAVASGADLRVSEDGTVAYRFGPHLHRRLLARSWQLRLEVAASWLWRLLFGLIRLSFGVVLVALVSVLSLLVLVIALVQILASDDGPEVVWELLWAGLELLVRLLLLLLSDGINGDAFKAGGMKRGGLTSGSKGNSSGRLLRGSTQPQQPGSAAAARGGEKRFAFLEAVYSVLFGDGDPNHALERRRWIRIGSFLQHRGGAVIAEDLAPLLDLPPRPADGQRAAELADTAMLAVLQRFDGRPAVNEQGDLAYHFPSLQVLAEGSAGRHRPHRLNAAASDPPPGGTPGQQGGGVSQVGTRPPDMGAAPARPPAADVQRGQVSEPDVAATEAPGQALGEPAAMTRGAEGPAPPLRERTIPFSSTTATQQRIYTGLCTALLLLSPLLLAMAHPAPAPLVGLALFAMAYALLLLLVPLLRRLVLRRRNRAIAIRNARRRSWVRFDPHQHRLLQRKRGFARSLARRQLLQAAELAYTTEQGLLEQEIDAAGD